MDVNNILASLNGLPALATGLLGAGGLYKLIEKLLDIRDKAAEREAVAGGERSKADSERIKELEARLFPLAERAATATFLEKENERVEAENVELRRELRVEQIERIQAQTVANGYKVFADLFTDDEGKAYLKAKFEAQKARERGNGAP